MSKPPRTALDDLAEHLRWYHRGYTVDDLEPARRGYLRSTKACSGPPRCPVANEHYHTIDISGRPDLVRGYYGRGLYAFWRAVCDEIRVQRGWLRNGAYTARNGKEIEINSAPDHVWTYHTLSGWCHGTGIIGYLRDGTALAEIGQEEGYDILIDTWRAVPERAWKEKKQDGHN